MTLKKYYQAYNGEQWKQMIDNLQEIRWELKDHLENHQISPDEFKKSIIVLLDHAEEAKDTVEQIFIHLGFDDVNLSSFLGAVVRKDERVIVHFSNVLDTWLNLRNRYGVLASLFIIHYYNEMLSFCSAKTFETVKLKLGELEPNWNGFINSLDNPDHGIFMSIISTGKYPDTLNKCEHKKIIRKMLDIGLKSTVGQRAKINRAIVNACAKGS